MCIAQVLGGGGLILGRNPAARTLVAVLLCRVGGPLVALRTSGRLDISSWQAMSRRCPNRKVALFLGRTTRAEVVSWRTRAREARRHPTSSRDPRDAGPAYPRLRCAGLLAPASPPAWRELATVRRQRYDGGTVHASSWVARPSRSPQSCGCNPSSPRSFDREQDHVVAETGRHELEAPEPNHRGARNRRNESGQLERDGKSLKNTQDPYLARKLSVFSSRGVTPTSKTSACSPSQMVMQEKTQIYPGSGKRRPYVQWGECLYYLAPKCLYMGEYKSVWMEG